MMTLRRLTIGLGACFIFTLLALFVPAQPRQVNPLNPNPYDRSLRPGSCRVYDIRAVANRPDSVTFEVQYYIPMNSLGACYISARIPDINSPSIDFTYVPAGAMLLGVPKGDIRFEDNVEFSLNYVGEKPLTTSTIEVFISDDNGSTICSRKIRWQKTWSPPGQEGEGEPAQNASQAQAASKTWAEVRGLKAVSESPGRVRLQVRYWLDPSYRRPCFISAAVPDFASPVATITATPAGIAPDGIPRGHQTYEDNVAFELTYNGAGPVSTSTVEVRISDQDGKVLASSIQKWGHDWGVGQPPEKEILR